MKDPSFIVIFLCDTDVVFVDIVITITLQIFCGARAFHLEENSCHVLIDHITDAHFFFFFSLIASVYKTCSATCCFASKSDSSVVLKIKGPIGKSCLSVYTLSCHY